MLGGLGICGKEFCCSQFLDEFQPVSIKMAKTQNLSLNPTKISGTCGRLMCCLKYEQDAYEELVKNAPKVDSYVETPEGTGTITEINLLRQKAKVRLETRGGDPVVSYFPLEEIQFIKTGKQRRAELASEVKTQDTKPKTDVPRTLRQSVDSEASPRPKSGERPRPAGKPERPPKKAENSLQPQPPAPQAEGAGSEAKKPRRRRKKRPGGGKPTDTPKS